MSVDTYLRKTSFKGYTPLSHNGAKILIANVLERVAQGMHIDIKRFLIFKSFDVQ